jgi:cation transport ATPase
MRGDGCERVAHGRTTPLACSPPAFRDRHGDVGSYFEAASVIVTLVLLGQVLELRARPDSHPAITIRVN